MNFRIGDPCKIWVNRNWINFVCGKFVTLFPVNGWVMMGVTETGSSIDDYYFIHGVKTNELYRESAKRRDRGTLM